MPIQHIPLAQLRVNHANDRHGELENETAAIAWLFNNREQHMKNLAKDLAAEGKVYELPLVSPEDDTFIVFDGNRRVTCLKLIENPRRAPTAQLQKFFTDLKSSWKGEFPKTLECQVEEDRDRIDEILFRRHTGTQKGVGQSTWDDRMKTTFVDRTGKGGGLNVADEVEKRLKAANKLPTKGKIPRSTLNRLLSAETFRNRVGFTTRGKKFEFTHDEEVVTNTLARIAADLASKTVVLGDLWDVDGKRSYLDQLERDDMLPNASHVLARPTSGSNKPQNRIPRPSTVKPPKPRNTLIPQTDFGIAWSGRLQRHRDIWEELQFKLHLSDHPNAISVLFRVLFELSIENYISQTGVKVNTGDKLAQRAVKAGEHMFQNSKISKKTRDMLKKFPQLDQLVSADTMNRYVHSANFAPSPDHLNAMWDSLSEFIVTCLKA